MSVDFYQFASDWDLPNPSPFCFKLETWLRLANIEYTEKAWSPGISSTGKAPVVRLNDELICDSTRIIERLTEEFDVKLDVGLDDKQRAISHLIRRTLEEHTYWAVISERWVDDAGFKTYAPVIGGALPALVRPLLVPVLRRGVKKSAHGQGLSRHTFEEVQNRARQDFDAVEQAFEGAFVLGDAPCTVDATVFSFVEGAAHPLFNNVVGRHLRASSHWRAYRQRMREHVWSDWAERMPPLSDA